MAQLILYTAEGVELGRRPMDAHERYAFYQCCQDHELIVFAHRRFRVHTVAWQVPSEQCVLLVSYDSDVVTDEPFAC